MLRKIGDIAVIVTIAFWLNGCVAFKMWDLVPEMRSKVRVILRNVEKHFPEYKWMIGVTYRSPEEQSKLYQIGRRGIPGEKIVTNTKSSRHTTRMAVDIYPTRDGQTIRYADAQAAYNYYGKLAKELGLIWSGDWSDPKDYGHIELSTNE